MMKFAVIFPAAGSASRFGGPRNKLLEPLGGVAVFARALGAFLSRGDVTRVVIAGSGAMGTGDADGDLGRRLADPRVEVCPGGATRAHSVRNALARVGGEIEWVAIHDAARPLVSSALIDRTLEAAGRHGAAAPALAVALTIKEADGPLPAAVLRTAPRHRLFAMQTPQIVRRADLERGFAECPIPLEQVTDDVQLLELIGLPVWLVEGEERNLKITTRMDMTLAEMLLAGEKPGDGT